MSNFEYEDSNKNYNKKNHENKIKHSLRIDYTNLGLNYKADFEEVRKAYIKLALIHHPDKGGDKSEFQKINNSYINIANRKIQDDEEEDNDEEDINIEKYNLSKSDIKKYEDHLLYKKYFTEKYNYHDLYYQNDVIKPFKLFFNITYETIETKVSFDETYFHIVDLWNNLSHINKRKYRGMVNTIELYKSFTSVEQLKQLLNVN